MQRSVASIGSWNDSGGRRKNCKAEGRGRLRQPQKRGRDRRSAFRETKQPNDTGRSTMYAAVVSPAFGPSEDVVFSKSPRYNFQRPIPGTVSTDPGPGRSPCPRCYSRPPTRQL